MADSGPSRSTGDRAGSELDIEIVRKSAAWDSVPISDAMLSRTAIAAFAAAAAAPEGQATHEVTLVLTDDAEMRELNRVWRGNDAPTNVLSFPSGESQGDPLLLGDVVLACETVEREATLQGIATPDHAAHLVVHGLLHLLGYDHLNEDEALKMETLETEILASLGIADPYADTGPAAIAEVSL
jgi:probable rRNA maturation factor